MMKFCTKTVKATISFFNKVNLYVVCISLASTTYAISFPDGVTGVTTYDYFLERLPNNTRGIYKIMDAKTIRYVGSAQDINIRLRSHHKNGILIPGNIIQAIIFDSAARQRDILKYEKELISKLQPVMNKHTGAPGRPWQSEQLSKLKTFYDHNQVLLTTKGKEELRAILAGEYLKEKIKLRKSLLRVMGLFR